MGDVEGITQNSHRNGSALWMRMKRDAYVSWGEGVAKLVRMSEWD
jgi:hypothetical protein